MQTTQHHVVTDHNLHGPAQYFSRPDLGSRQTSARSDPSSDDGLERRPLTATAIRIQKYGLGKSSRNAPRLSPRTSGFTPIVLNATPPLDSGYFDFPDVRNEKLLSRPMSPLSFNNRPLFQRSASSGSTLKASSKLTTISSSDSSMLFDKAGSPNFTTLPPTLSHAAAKRLGIDLGMAQVVPRSIPRDQLSISSLSDQYSFSGEAPSLSELTEESVGDHKEDSVGIHTPRRPDRDSWPLRSNPASPQLTMHEPASDQQATAFYASSTDLTIEDTNESVTSLKSSKASYDIDVPKKLQEQTIVVNVPTTTVYDIKPSPASPIDERALGHRRRLSNFDRHQMMISSRKNSSSNRTLTSQYSRAQPLRVEGPRTASEDSHQPHAQPNGANRAARSRKYDFEAHMEDAVTPDAAEKVIFSIFERIDNFSDLFAAARINRGFYSVFKRHELQLMKRALYNSSPAAWEYREVSAKQIIGGAGAADYTPTTYVQFHKRDNYILKSLKSLLFTRCQSHLRQETINALHNQSDPSALRIDNAIWRIWTFCDIFGPGIGRENDILAQKAWLEGTKYHSSGSKPATSGRTSRSTTGSSSKSPKSFGKGNPGGLNASELIDMLEIWKCLRFLLKGVTDVGRVAQARRYGIFDGMDIDFSDPKAEEAMLEEWLNYILTLGPSTVVDLATPATSKTAAVFRTARDMGWTVWRPCPRDGCRMKFLKDVVNTMYELKQTSRRTDTVHHQHHAPLSARHHISNSTYKSMKKQVYPTNDTFVAETEDPVALWMQWTSNHDEPPMPARQPRTHEPMSDVSKVAKLPKHHQRHTPILPPSIIEEDQSSTPRRSPSALSLFPPEYTRSDSPALLSGLPSTAGQSSQTPVAGLSGEQRHLDLQPQAKVPFTNKMSTYGRVTA